jgi:hypothetical protein
VPFRTRLVAGLFGEWGGMVWAAVARAGISVPHSIALLAIDAGHRCARALRGYFGAR